ncbi:MAG: 50S ribosomal protein L9 [Thermoleophilia bacterium]|jgi:large subunit ribosomal protein L9|nr:50S ribosomal protein L9 [Actinomycetota bacterium]MCL6093989.1 50S ribosomal protein L9 [Actinomycetota bacterium]MDA8167054.1 50S ribosomal protein L9 [Actinomycetota bacterium]
MDMILLQDVAGLGQKGQVVTAADGYARNFLLPRKLAEIATPGRVAEVRRRQEEAEVKVLRDAERADELAETLGKTVLTVTAQAGEDGKLFGSVTAADISDAIYDARKVRVDKKKISLPEPIKETGDYMVEIEVHSGVNATTKVIVAAAR